MHRLRATYDGTPSSVRVARHEVQEALESWGMPDLVWPVTLVVTELATNALLHAHTPFTVTLGVLPGRAVRLEVADGSPRAPRPRHYDEDATTGRGLRLVESLARDWGVEAAPVGKQVWVELASADERSGADDEGDVEALLLSFPDLADEDDVRGNGTVRTA